MPPKKKDTGPSKKTEVKRKEKVVEDKTFGLKNKKGTKQQKFIKIVEQQVKGKSDRRTLQEQESQQKKKDEKQRKLDELNMLFKPVDQKVAKGVDPKSVVCAFFKQGLCTKGDKCKFSHDLAIGRKSEKKNIYEDDRTDEKMDDWDEAKLEDVVNKKHGTGNKNNPTAIICKYFLDSVEMNKYGWFWECPNGKGCIYRHALPPGFALKKNQKKIDKKDEISLEELIERERASLNSQNLTKVTYESFLRWKERKRKEKISVAVKEQAKKKADYRAGKQSGISGRELFEFNPDLVAGDDDDASAVIEREDLSEDEFTEINAESLVAQESEKKTIAETRLNPVADQNGVEKEVSKNGEAAAITNVEGINIDENLFDPNELDQLDLEALEIDDNAVEPIDGV